MTASEKEVQPCIDLAKKRIALNEGVRIAKLNYDFVDKYKDLANFDKILETTPLLNQHWRQISDFDLTYNRTFDSLNKKTGWNTCFKFRFPIPI